MERPSSLRFDVENITCKKEIVVSPFKITLNAIVIASKRLVIMRFNFYIATFVIFLSPNLLHAQECLDSVVKTSPEMRFEVQNDGTVIDNKTGLMWIQCSIGQIWSGGSCDGVADEFSWNEALTFSKDAEFAGYGDWRLPNIKELSSIVELACFSPAINSVIFPATESTFFWTSTPFTIENSFDRDVWVVNFDDGYDWSASFADKHLIRLVRQ